MKILDDHSLQSLNTFGIEAKARHYAEVETEEELASLLSLPHVREQEKLILGGGSNVLFTRDFEGLVIRIGIRGMHVIQEDADHVWLECGAGEVWHDVVVHAVENEWGGIENLSLIPGKIGAAPIQNIGAYGVELKEVFEYLSAVEIETGDVHTFNLQDCDFGYRNSVFKQALKNKYIITRVVLKLSKKPELKTTYGTIQQELEQLQKQDGDYTIRDISDAVIRIRRSKLPDPAVTGNAGSFFKNPEVPKAKYDELKQAFPEIPGYVIDDDHVKIPAAWLIEQAGWKGRRFGNYGVHDRQALVLVNYGGARGRDIYELSEKIRQSVLNKFGIELEREVNVV